MTTLRAVAFALGMALVSTGAAVGDSMPARPGYLTGGQTFIMPDGIQVSTTIAGMVELSPDQKLARAYALCMHKDGKAPMLLCARIEAKVEDTPTTDADRAFIEEVANGLK